MAERASNFLKAKLKESEVTYVELAKRLKKHGFAETEASITNKLKRGDIFGNILSGLPCGTRIGRCRFRGDLVSRDFAIQ
jgi:Domain of unknown function (DUF6471)